jgi:hypothetical protein
LILGTYRSSRYTKYNYKPQISGETQEKNYLKGLSRTYNIYTKINYSSIYFLFNPPADIPCFINDNINNNNRILDRKSSNLQDIILFIINNIKTYDLISIITELGSSVAKSNITNLLIKKLAKIILIYEKAIA